MIKFIYKKTAFTLIEILIVTLIFSLLFGVLIGIFLVSNKAWKEGQLALEKQQLARIAMDNVVNVLRKTSSNWDIEGIYYPVTINSDGSQIDFYLPVFDSNNQIIQLIGSRIYVSSSTPIQLLKKVGSGSAQVIGNFIDTSSSEKPYFQFVTADNNVVQINIPILKGQSSTFRLSGQVYFRNSAQALSGVIVEPLQEEGE